jgi:hypothetical protein
VGLTDCCAAKRHGRFEFEIGAKEKKKSPSTKATKEQQKKLKEEQKKLKEGAQKQQAAAVAHEAQQLLVEVVVFEPMARWVLAPLCYCIASC